MASGYTGDTLVGGAANDTLTDHGSGPSTMIGGAGTNLFNLQNVGDVVQETTVGTNSTIQTTVSFSLPTNVNNLILNGFTGTTGTANNANDSIVGNSSQDTMIAGTGNDTFTGNGTGESFVLNAGYGHDQITAQSGDSGFDKPLL